MSQSPRDGTHRAARAVSSCLLGLAGLACLGQTGCLVPASQLSAYRSQFEQSQEKNKSLEAQIANLDEHSRKVESELRSAEEDLATLGVTSNADRRRLVNLQSERDALYGRFGDHRGRVPLIVSDQLAELAQRHSSLYFDRKSGVAKLDSDVLFATAEADLQPKAQELLGEFAAILRSAEAKSLKVMVVGHTDDERIKGQDVRSDYPNNWHLGAARALAVTDFLRVRGLQESRMGIASYGSFQPVADNKSPSDRQRNRRVELFLIAPDVPVVGWTETFPHVYR